MYMNRIKQTISNNSKHSFIDSSIDTRKDINSIKQREVNNADLTVSYDDSHNLNRWNNSASFKLFHIISQFIRQIKDIIYDRLDRIVNIINKVCDYKNTTSKLL